MSQLKEKQVTVFTSETTISIHTNDVASTAVAHQE